MIAIIDYGMGNLRSVEKALEKVGAEVRVTRDPDEIRQAGKLVLPGVGAFGDAMENLRKRNLTDVIREEVQSGKPFLGICLGLDLIFEESDEHGLHQGFGFLPGRVELLDTGFKIPHIGWNQARFEKQSRLLDGVPDGSYFYFVHSYAVVPRQETDILCTTDYGGTFVSAVERDNIAAVQFHPEKSSSLGLTILKNFAEKNSAR
ncbi:MAG: imidazole glycerol phosphate synthase subunit HisH [Thermoleophilia bacterium]|nr:imidazole glycerol phosphate synthase subunit HisH [Thermoleophilia bacterium]